MRTEEKTKKDHLVSAKLVVAIVPLFAIGIFAGAIIEISSTNLALGSNLLFVSITIFFLVIPKGIEIFKKARKKLDTLTTLNAK